MDISKFTPNQLTIIDKPTTGRIIGYAISGVGIILMMTNLQRVQRDFLFWMGLALAMAGLAYQSFLREDTSCVLDKDTGLISIKRNMGFLRTYKEESSLSEITKIRIEVKNPNKTQKQSGDQYRISLKFGENRWIPITRKFLRKELKEMEEIAGSIQQFISE